MGISSGRLLQGCGCAEGVQRSLGLPAAEPPACIVHAREHLGQARREREAGHERFLAGELDRAMGLYDAALVTLDNAAEAAGSGSTSPRRAVRRDAHSLRLALESDLRAERALVLVNAAESQKRLGDLEKVVRLADAALALESDSVKALYLRGTARRGSGMFMLGIEDLERARELDPENVSVRAELARARATDAAAEGVGGLGREGGGCEGGGGDRGGTGLRSPVISPGGLFSRLAEGSRRSSSFDAEADGGSGGAAGQVCGADDAQDFCSEHVSGGYPVAEDADGFGGKAKNGSPTRQVAPARGTPSGAGANTKRAMVGIKPPSNLIRLPGVQIQTETRCSRTQGMDHEEVLRRQESNEAPVLRARYEAEFGAQHPPFLELTFWDALAEAERIGRPLLVWLRSTRRREIDGVFGKRIWPNQAVQDAVAEHFLLWFGDVDRWLTPSQLRHKLRLPSVPALVVLTLLTAQQARLGRRLLGQPLDGAPCEFPAGTTWKVIRSFDLSRVQVLGQECANSVATFVRECGELCAEERRRATATESRLREFQERNAPPEEQNSEAAPPELALPELAESLRADEDATREGHSPLSLRRRAAAERLLAAEREGPGGLLPEGPAHDSCRVVVRLPDGRRLERTFSAGSPAAAVYEWAACADELELLAAAAAGGDSVACAAAAGASSSSPRVKVPEHFMLNLTYPRRELPRSEVSLRDAGLCPSAALALSPTDGESPAVEQPTATEKPV